MPLPGSPANALPADDAALMRRIEGIERQLRELGPSVASSIFPMIADLQAQADATDAVVAAMADVIAAQVSYEVAATSTASAWTVSTGMVTKASTTITVPAGYTQALVWAHAAMHFQDSAPNGGYLRAVIDASAGSEMGGLANLNVGQSANHTAALTGLSGGGTITLACQVRASVASAVTTGRLAQIAGSAIFLR